MNPFKQLSIEFEGIRNTITGYTSHGNIGNFLEELKTGIDTRDFELISYTLGQIISWYEQNLDKIHSNQFVINYDEHSRNYQVLVNIQKELTADDCVPSNSIHHIDEILESEPNDSDPIIFISHRSSDQKYGDALRNFIIGLGVKNDQLIYSSHPLHKIPLDQNIFEYLRNNIHSNVFMIILWSDEYLDSPACLNEMGAAWVVQSDYTNIYVPTFSFGNPKYHECAVDTKKMGAVLNGDQHCRASMLELKDKIVSLFDLQDDEQQVMYLLEEFIKEISPK